MINDSGLKPMEYNVVVKPDAVEEVTPGGIILPVTQTDRDKLAVEEGMLVAVSPHAFSYAEWDGAKPPQVGERVVFARYAGALHKRGEQDYRIIKDKDIIAVVEDVAERKKLSISTPAPHRSEAA